MLASALWLPGGLADAPTVAFGAAPPDGDLLYVQPAHGITTDALAEALGRLGFDVGPPIHASGVRVHVPPDEDARALQLRLAASHLVRSVEVDAVVRAAQLTPDEPPPEEADEPNDPLYITDQRAYLAAIGAPEAWAAGADGSGVLIAVIDTGVDYDHPDLIPRLAVNPADDLFDDTDDDLSGCPDDVLGCNFVSLATADPSCGYVAEPPNWRTRDDEGHGTFVAGIAAATGNNEVGVTGVAPGALLLPVKVLDCTATGRISDAAAGIRYAADMGAGVINISFGTPNDSPALRDAIEYAQQRGAVIVASAGNDGSSGITYPAAYPHVLSVAASGDASGGTLEYRATAPFARFGFGVDYLAPGVDLVSTFPGALCGTNQWQCTGDGPYARSTGSSFATPIVAGAVAVALSAHPDRSVEFVLSMLLASRHERLSGQLSRLLDVGAAVEREIYGAGAPGTSRDGDGAPQGPTGP